MTVFRQCLRYRPQSAPFNYTSFKASILARGFRVCSRHNVLKPFILPDIGEGIKEVQIIQWFVEPEARVEQFDKLCEVQSDKAATEITSRFDGVIKKLHYAAEEMAQVGKPLCDIDVDGEPLDEGLEAEASNSPLQQAGPPESPQQPQKAVEHILHQHGNTGSTRRYASLATPAVRSLLNELKVDIASVIGTGRDGRVLKEDVRNYVAARDSSTTNIPSASSAGFPPIDPPKQVEQSISLTPIQSQMFKTMTRSLQIPHFLYTDEINLTSLSALRNRLNAHLTSVTKLSALSFIIKAVSFALLDYPLLNTRIETGDDFESPKIILRAQHNIGVAMDTPQGLLVPNIKNVGSLSIISIGAEILRLQSLARANKLSVTDLTGGTVTVSNIGSIGGTYVSPVIVSNEVAILGIGKARTVPSFDEESEVVKKEIVNFSWSADHRVVDGATMARMAEKVRGFVEEPGWMLVKGR